MTSSDEQVLEVQGLHKAFRSRSSANPFEHVVVPAVDDVSFAIDRGETVALVGESGSGKSTLARCVLRLHAPDGGRIVLLGREVQDLRERRFRPHRRHVQMVFQNPLASFDPMRTIGSSLNDALELSEPKRERRTARIADLLEEVGLSPRFAALRPRSVSGGELQRAAIARAIATYPDLVVLDEPTSALDMSIQGQVLALLRDLQAKQRLSYLLVTHDLRMVRVMANRVMVMYLGQIVEMADVDELLDEPLHPYTAALLSASELKRRGVDAGASSAEPLAGSLRYPDPGYVGCRLRERCPFAADGCEQRQELVEVRPRHWVRCWRSADGQLPSLLSAR